MREGRIQFHLSPLLAPHSEANELRHQKSGQALSTEWEMQCEAVQTLLPARSTYLDTETSREQAGRNLEGEPRNQVALQSMWLSPPISLLCFTPTTVLCATRPRVRTGGFLSSF